MDPIPPSMAEHASASMKKKKTMIAEVALRFLWRGPPPTSLSRKEYERSLVPWMPNTRATCPVCGLWFSLLNRRHHVSLAPCWIQHPPRHLARADAHMLAAKPSPVCVRAPMCACLNTCLNMCACVCAYVWLF